MGWSGSSSEVLAVSSHSESATARGAVSASATIPSGWGGSTVTSSAFVHHVVRVQPSAGGYQVKATLTGVVGSPSGTGSKVRLHAYIAGAANLGLNQKVVQDVSTGEVTLTADVPAVTSVSTLVMDAGVLAQPTGSGEVAASASASATVTKITLTPLGG
jgi:hypothetical protein